MSKHRKKTRQDVAEVARSIVEQVIGDTLSGKPKPQPEEPVEPDTRNPAAVALSKLGASKGGKERAKKLAPERRKEIARQAAKQRWKSTNRLP